MSTFWTVTIIILCIVFQAFFSGSEMVLLSSRKIRLRRKRNKGSKGADLALKMIANSKWYLACTSTGTNMAVVVASVIAAMWFEKALGPYGELGTILVISPLLLMFGEIIPRTVFQYRATELAPKVSYGLLVLSYIISPVTGLVFGISRLFYPKSNHESLNKRSFASREELELILNIPAKGSDVHKKEKKLIQQIFMFSKAEAGEAMVPLIDVWALPITTTINDAVELIRKTGFSRIPVYKGRIFNIVGIVRAFDIIGLEDTNMSIKKFVREVPYVPELKKLDELLVFLQKSRKSIAIVVDEYGGATGIVTMEDIIEEVMGEIRDEYDHVVDNLIKLGKNKYKVNARMEIDHLNDQLNVTIPKDNYETLGGFILKQMGRIPRPGEMFDWEDMRFKISQASKRTVIEVIIEHKVAKEKLIQE
ncbi:MAG: hemolysin family protein [Proteobacteria bacterium]|nr:hemolysin family protein [Pseudomonadota bacterium]